MVIGLADRQAGKRTNWNSVREFAVTRKQAGRQASRQTSRQAGRQSK